MITHLLLILSLCIAIVGFLQATVETAVFWIATIAVTVILMFSVGNYGEIEQTAYLFILTFNALALGTDWLIKKLKLAKPPKTEPADSQSSQLYFFSGIVLFLLAVAVFTASINSSSGVLETWVNIATTRSTGEIVLANISIALYLTSILLFLISGGRVPSTRVVLVILFSGLTFSVLVRAKSMIPPFILPLAYLYVRSPSNSLLAGLPRVSVVIMLSILLYILVFAARWSGNLENFSVNQFYVATSNVIDAGIERNLSDHMFIVFSYFQHAPILDGQTYLRLTSILTQFLGYERMGNTSHFYAGLTGFYDSSLRASVHPTLYGDSFANFGYFGVLIGAAWVAFLYAYRNLLSGTDRKSVV